MVISMPINTVDGRVRLSWHHYAHLTHTDTHSCHYYKTWLQNIISGVPDRAGAKLAIEWIQNPQTGLQITLNRAALVFIWIFRSILPLSPFPSQFVFALLFWQWLLFTFLSSTSPLLKPQPLHWLASAHLCDSLSGPREWQNQRRAGARGPSRLGWKPSRWTLALCGTMLDQRRPCIGCRVGFHFCRITKKLNNVSLQFCMIDAQNLCDPANQNAPQQLQHRSISKLNHWQWQIRDR